MVQFMKLKRVEIIRRSMLRLNVSIKSIQGVPYYV
jgi:hypothetical protein